MTSITSKNVSSLDVQRILIRICDDCRDWFKPPTKTPALDNCPRCGKNGLRWIAMRPEIDDDP